MKKILMRSGKTQFETVNAEQALTGKLLGNNSGNFFYAFGIERALMCDDTVIDSTHYKYKFSNEEIERINSEYDCFVIPLACAFRDTFINELNGLTDLVNSLRIPCYVIGVGLTAPYEPKLNEGFIFDKDVKKFVRAVLNKSSCIGVRGEITGDYLKTLGFSEGRDYMPIGCPSMYTYGDSLSLRKTTLNRDAVVSFSQSAVAPENVIELTAKFYDFFPNSNLVFQTQKELNLLYTGVSYIKNKTSRFICSSVNDDIYKKDRVKFFLDVPCWIDFMKSCDLAVGARFHGNIAAVLAGTPSIVLSKDARMRELVDFHNLTSINVNDISDDVNIKNILDNLDFESHLKVQKRNLENYIEFLKINGIKNIFNEGLNPRDTLFDKKISEISVNGSVKSLIACDINETVDRFKFMKQQVDKKEKEIKNIKAEIKKNLPIKTLRFIDKLISYIRRFISKLQRW